MLDFAVELAREAGEILLRAYGKVDRREIGYKDWRNLVTETDLEVEERLAERITSRFPEHGILGEERIDRAPRDRERHRWILDPLDGTTNFVHAHPIFCVSIGLERNGEGRIGVIFAPVLDELYVAERGNGATLNGSPCRVSDEEDLSHALLGSGFAYGRDERVEVNLAHWARLSRLARGLRRCGSAALDLAFVASGRYDGFWEMYLSPWDIAAGAVLVEEAGGRVSDFRGGGDWRDGHEILATNGRLHERIRSHLADPGD
ncbi:MAG: inositol monophosphatase [Candidatus Eisenbacteria bacterium]|nr:inositol monophosphatase [Candidatus Latescibacterota bacterium]MBD3302075.1 inositol monophosphatase [Candidatus Eisenbacteria bacterium]